MALHEAIWPSYHRRAPKSRISTSITSIFILQPLVGRLHSPQQDLQRRTFPNASAWSLQAEIECCARVWSSCQSPMSVHSRCAQGHSNVSANSGARWDSTRRILELGPSQSSQSDPSWRRYHLQLVGHLWFAWQGPISSSIYFHSFLYGGLGQQEKGWLVYQCKSWEKMRSG